MAVMVIALTWRQVSRTLTCAYACVQHGRVKPAVAPVLSRDEEAALAAKVAKCGALMSAAMKQVCGRWWLVMM